MNLGIDWGTLMGPMFTDIVKALIAIISAMLIAGLKLIYQKESHNAVATKFLNFLVGKAIENQLANPMLDNSELWKKLVANAEKIGIDPKLVKNLEAQIMAGVNAWFISQNFPNVVTPSSTPVLPASTPLSPTGSSGT